ncbi:MAG TPA: LecA/PA-IL family lectin [Pyrinomonadaceae bacterium]|jgi:hypothetical protein
MKKIILALLVLIMAATVAAADTVYLRDGRTIRGTVLGFISGRFAVRVTSATAAQTTSSTSTTTAATINAGDIIFLRPREIDRIEIEGRSLDDARYVTRSVDVELGPNWIDSGVDLKRGERVQVTATGTIVAGRTRITPGGLRSTDPYAPLPRSAEGVLIGAISDDPNAPIIEIGINREFVADRDGRLYLTANRSSYTDARGAFTAQIRREIDLSPRTARNRDNNRNEDDESYDPFGTDNRTTPGRIRRRARTETSTGNVSPTPTPTPIEKSVSVAGNAPRGTDTGIDLRTGDQVTISASGNITAGRRAGVVSPEGGRISTASALGVGGYPVPNAGVGALIGVIRLTSGQFSQAFFVGSQLSFNAPADGRLILLANDDNYNDNSGSFDVKITVAPSSSSSSQPSGTQTNTPDNINVPADSQGTDTGIDLRRGDRVTINASGVIFPSESSPRTSPDGNRGFSTSRSNYPMPDAGHGALIGYIRLTDGRRTRPFYVGSQQAFTVPDDGRLFLLINDDDYRDNTGNFSVRVSY